MDAETTTRGPAEVLPPDAPTMRRVCGLFATGVTVVTSAIDREWMGATVNSFTSVSLSPPRVLFCLRRDSRVLAAVRGSGVFAVSFLEAEQGGLARQLAAPGPSRLHEVPCLRGTTGAPIVRDGIGYLEGRVADEFDGGDHRIVVGAVTSLGTLHNGAPLAYFQGRLTRLDKEK